jgi:dolichol-phosphate mannosyltransferase
VVLWLASLTGASFAAANPAAVIAAMTWNFVFNNIITYRDQRLRGRAFAFGLASFYAIGAIGAIANVGIADALFDRGRSWWLAGIAGALMGVIWNFTMSSFFTWRRSAA